MSTSNTPAEKLTKEGGKAAAAYAAYAALGTERSLAKLAQSLGRPAGYVSVLERWSRDYGWQRRIRDYDKAELVREEQERAEVRAKKQREREEDIERMNSRHAQIGVTQQLKAIEQINRLITSDSFGSIAAVQLLKLATDLERAARGEPDKTLMQLVGKDGGPIQTAGHVAVYLPQKDALPPSSPTAISSESSETEKEQTQ